MRFYIRCQPLIQRRDRHIYSGPILYYVKQHDNSTSIIRDKTNTPTQKRRLLLAKKTF